MNGQVNEKYRAARIYPPGRTLKDEIEARGWTQKEFAEIIGRPVQFVSELINAKRGLTVEAAKELEAALDISAELWLNLETRYRLRLEEEQSDKKKMNAIKRRATTRELAGAR